MTMKRFLTYSLLSLAILWLLGTILGQLTDAGFLPQSTPVDNAQQAAAAYTHRVTEQCRTALGIPPRVTLSWDEQVRIKQCLDEHAGAQSLTELSRQLGITR